MWVGPSPADLGRNQPHKTDSFRGWAGVEQVQPTPKLIICRTCCSRNGCRKWRLTKERLTWQRNLRDQEVELMVWAALLGGTVARVEEDEGEAVGSWRGNGERERRESRRRMTGREEKWKQGDGWFFYAFWTQTSPSSGHEMNPYL